MPDDPSRPILTQGAEADGAAVVLPESVHLVAKTAARRAAYALQPRRATRRRTTRPSRPAARWAPATTGDADEAIRANILKSHARNPPAKRERSKMREVIIVNRPRRRIYRGGSLFGAVFTLLILFGVYWYVTHMRSAPATSTHSAAADTKKK